MKKSIVAFLLAFTVSIIGYSQVTFSGKVLDENNVPLPGASVVVKGGSTGVATDFDGNFEIRNFENRHFEKVSKIFIFREDTDEKLPITEKVCMFFRNMILQLKC